jgi:hypothetical protein
VFWFIVWILIAIIVFGAFFWSLKTLFDQKRAWKTFGDKYKLTFTRGTIMKSPTLEGVIAGYKLLVFSQDRATNDVRGKRYMTVIQLALPSGMPTGGAIASAVFAEFIRQLSLPHSIKIVHEGWDYTLITQAQDEGVLEEFLTPARLTALDQVVQLKNCTMLYIFDRQETYLRVETPEALDTPSKLDVIVKKMITAANTLSVQGKEKPASAG